MNFAVERLKGFTTMADNRSRECGQSFLRHFDRAGDEELVVRSHEGKVQRAACNVQCGTCRLKTNPPEALPAK
jgi:hypothetical protein